MGTYKKSPLRPPVYISWRRNRIASKRDECSVSIIERGLDERIWSIKHAKGELCAALNIINKSTPNLLFCLSCSFGKVNKESSSTSMLRHIDYEIRVGLWNTPIGVRMSLVSCILVISLCCRRSKACDKRRDGGQIDRWPAFEPSKWLNLANLTLYKPVL